MRSGITPFLMMALLLVPAGARAGIPGWLEAGADAAGFTAVRDTVVTHEGKTSARYESIREPKNFGTLMQCVDAADFRGKRLRFSAFVKTKDVVASVGLWMRVDGKENPMQPLAFDNMTDRRIKGTTDWKQYSVVLDVAENASQICFGVLNTGAGKLWISDIQFEPVGRDVPVTAGPEKETPGARTQPVNLGFEK